MGLFSRKSNAEKEAKKKAKQEIRAQRAVEYQERKEQKAAEERAKKEKQIAEWQKQLDEYIALRQKAFDRGDFEAMKEMDLYIGRNKALIEDDHDAWERYTRQIVGLQNMRNGTSGPTVKPVNFDW